MLMDVVAKKQGSIYAGMMTCNNNKCNTRVIKDVGRGVTHVIVEAVADITALNANIFTKLDAMKGYHKCPFDEESQLLTTFITPF